MNRFDVQNKHSAAADQVIGRTAAIWRALSRTCQSVCVLALVSASLSSNALDLSLWPISAAAADDRSSLFAQPQVRSDSAAKRAASSAREAVGGRILSVKPAKNGHKVRLLVNGGRVVTVDVDNKGRVRGQ